MHGSRQWTSANYPSRSTRFHFVSSPRVPSKPGFAVRLCLSRSEACRLNRFLLLNHCYWFDAERRTRSLYALLSNRKGGNMNWDYFESLVIPMSRTLIIDASMSLWWTSMRINGSTPKYVDRKWIVYVGSLCIGLTWHGCKKGRNERSQSNMCWHIAGKKSNADHFVLFCMKEESSKIAMDMRSHFYHRWSKGNRG